jgi:hypothetical protein
LGGVYRLFAGGVVVVVVVVPGPADALIDGAGEADAVATAIGTAIGMVARANDKGTLAVRRFLAIRSCFFVLAFFAARRAFLLIVRSPSDVIRTSR